MSGQRTLSRRAALAGLAGAICPAAPARPNLVLMLADDLGYGDVGYTGCPDIRTPRLDALAKEGVRFTRAYANAPVCSPTRAALLTGQYQQRTGMENVIYVGEREKGLTADAVLLPQLLKKQGYSTGIIGKWHLGFEKRYFPTRRGFDEFAGFLAGNIDYFSHVDRLANPDLWRNEQPIRDGRYMTDLIAQESCDFIDRHAGKPFFLYVPFNAPHDPFQGPMDRHTAWKSGPVGSGTANRETYRAMVEALDEAVGMIVDRLEARGIDGDTAVFFLSDNGGVPKVARNAPFRGYKGSLWEGGIRSPLVARWKGQFRARAASDALAAGMDLFSTCLEIAGAAPPAGRTIDGVSLLEACRGGAGRREPLFFRYQDPKAGEQRAVIGRQYKYLRDAGGEEHLFDLLRDPGESENLKEKHPAVLARLKGEYESWLKDVTAVK